MKLTVGNKVVYPGQGPCIIGAVVKRVVEDRPMMFYQLLILKGGDAELFVPVEKIRAIGIRPLLGRFEIQKLFDQLREPSQRVEDFRQRAQDNLKRFASGSPFDLVEVIKSLTDLREVKSLSIKERDALERARILLVCEISEVMEETREEAEEQIDNALKARREEINVGQESSSDAYNDDRDREEISGRSEAQRAEVRSA